MTTASLPGTTVLEEVSLGELVTIPALPVAPVNRLFGREVISLLPQAWKVGESLRDGDNQKQDGVSHE